MRGPRRTRGTRGMRRMRRTPIGRAPTTTLCQFVSSRLEAFVSHLSFVLATATSITSIASYLLDAAGCRMMMPVKTRLGVCEVATRPGPRTSLQVIMSATGPSACLLKASANMSYCERVFEITRSVVSTRAIKHLTQVRLAEAHENVRLKHALRVGKVS